MSFDGTAIVGLVGANGAPVPEGGQHVTLCYLGVIEDGDARIDGLHLNVSSLAAVVPQFKADVIGRETFGGEDEQADVLLVSPDRFAVMRNILLTDPDIAELTAAAQTFPDYKPHMTLGYIGEDGYAAEPCDLAEIDVIGLGLWIAGHQTDYLFSSQDAVLEDPDEMAVDTVQASAGEWTENLHPRGKDGKFIEKFGIVKFLDMLTGSWNYGKVVGMNEVNGKASITVRPSDLEGNAIQGKKDIDLPQSKIYSAPKVKAHIKKTEMKKVGEQAGSNEGGLYSVVSVELQPGGNPKSALVGQKFYVKKAKTKSHGQNEALANALYEEAGVFVPEVEYDPEDGNLYSKIVPGEHDMSSQLKNPEWVSKVQANFAVDAWLSNRDVFGLTWDNILTDEGGEPIRIDNGGALLYRAMGEKKTDFGSKVTELDIFRQDKKAAVFGSNMPKSAELDGAQRVLAISPEKIEEMVAAHQLPKSLADTLKARRAYIADYYGLPLPESMQPSGSDHITAAPLVDPLDSSKSGGMPRTWSKSHDSLISLGVVAEPGDEIKNATGIHTLGIEGEQQMFVGDHLAMLQAQGGPFQLKKMKIGPRVSQATLSTAPNSASALVALEWQRGDRITVGGVLLDVLGVNRQSGVMLVSPTPLSGGDSSPAFQLNVFNLPGDSIETHPWDPPAAVDELPAPSEKTGMAAEIASQAKADLMEPLPDSAPPVTPVAAAEPGAGIGAATKSNVKTMPLGDGTVAATGDKVTSKVDGKEYTFLKPKGAFAVVTDETGKQFMKKASTMTQPGKEAVLIPGADLPAPTMKDGTVPVYGMTVIAPDGKYGKIMNISPDGKSVFFKDQSGVKVKKSTGVVISGEPTKEPDAVPAGTPDMGSPGLVGVNYAKMKPGDLKGGPTFYVKDPDLGKTLVFTKHADGKVYIEKWANQPLESLVLSADGKYIGAWSTGLDTVPVMMKAKDFPVLDPDWESYEVHVGGKVLIVSPEQVGSEIMYGYDADTNIWSAFESDSVVMVAATNNMAKPVGSVKPAVLKTGKDSPDEAKNLGDLIASGSIIEGVTKVSVDGVSWWSVSSMYPDPDGSYSVRLESLDGQSIYWVFSSSHATFVVDNRSALDTIAVPESAPDMQELPGWEQALMAVPAAPGEEIAGPVEKTYADLVVGDKIGVGKTFSAIVLGNDGVHLTLLSKKGLKSFMPLSMDPSDTFMVPGNVNGGIEVTPKQAAVLLEGKTGSFHFGSGDAATNEVTIHELVTDSSGGKHLIAGTGDDIYDLGSLETYGDIVLTITGDVSTDAQPEKVALIKNDIFGTKETVTAADVATGAFSMSALNEALGMDVISTTPTPILFSKKHNKYFRVGPDGKTQSWEAGAKEWKDAPEISTASMNKAVDAVKADFTFKQYPWIESSATITPADGLKVFSVELAPGDQNTAVTVGSHSDEGPFYLFNVDGTVTGKEALALKPEMIATKAKLFDPWETKKEVAPEATTDVPEGQGIADLPVLDCGNGTYAVQPGDKVAELSFPSSPGLSIYMVKSAETSPDWYLIESNGVPGLTNYSDAQMNKMIAASDSDSVTKIIFSGADSGADVSLPAAHAPAIGKFTPDDGSSVYKIMDEPGLWAVKSPGSGVWVLYAKSGNNIGAYHGDAQLTADYPNADHVYGPKIGEEAQTVDTFSGFVPTDGDVVVEIKGYPPMFVVQHPDEDIWFAIKEDGTEDPHVYADYLVQGKLKNGNGKIVFGGKEAEKPAVPAPVEIAGYTPKPGDIVISGQGSYAGEDYVKQAGTDAWYPIKDGKPDVTALASSETQLLESVKEGLGVYSYGGPALKSFKGYTPDSDTAAVIYYPISDVYYAKLNSSGFVSDTWYMVMGGTLAKSPAIGLSKDVGDTAGAAKLVYGTMPDKAAAPAVPAAPVQAVTSTSPTHLAPGMSLKTVDGVDLSQADIDALVYFGNNGNDKKLPAGTKLYKTSSDGELALEFSDGTGAYLNGLSFWYWDKGTLSHEKKYATSSYTPYKWDPVNLNTAQPAPSTVTVQTKKGITTSTGDYLPTTEEMEPGTWDTVMVPGTIVYNNGMDQYFKVEKVVGNRLYFESRWNMDGGEIDVYDDDNWIGLWDPEGDFLVAKSGVSTAPEAPTAPAAPEVEVNDGITKPSAEAVASWGGDLTKDGYIPFAGMNVIGKGPMIGKVIAVSADKTKATVLTSDGKKTTRLIKALGSNISANYSEKLGPVVAKKIPEGMTLPVPGPKEAFAGAFAKLGSMFALINGHKGVRNGETMVMGATAPSGKKYARVNFSLTKEQRGLLKDLLESGPAAQAPPKKMGAWQQNPDVQSETVAVGMNLAMRPSTSPPGKWKVDPSGDKATHTVVSVGAWDNGRAEVVLKNMETGEEIISGFHSGYSMKTFVWDPNKPAPAPKPVSSSYGSLKLSAHAQALGWELLSSSDGVTAGISGSVGGTIQAEPGSKVPSNKSAFLQLGSTPMTNAVRMKMADGTVIEVTNIGDGNNSYHGVVTVSIPEGGDSVSAYSAAMSALGMEHAEHTQESTKEKARPLLRMLAFGGHTDLDTNGGYSDEKIFAQLGKTMGIPDLGWQDVQIGVDESVGKVSYFWSDRAKNAIAAKTKTNMIIRAASSADAKAIVSTIKGGTASAILKRVTGMVDPSTGKGLGASPDSDAANNAGHGGFMSAKKITGHIPTSNDLASYKGSNMMVYQRMDSVLARIGDFRLNTSSDAFGKGSSNNLEAMMSSSVKDFWVGGGVPSEAISFIAVNSQTERAAAIKQLQSEGIVQIGGRPVEEIIVLQTEIANMTEKTFPPFTYKPQTVAVLDLP